MLCWEKIGLFILKYNKSKECDVQMEKNKNLFDYYFYKDTAVVVWGIGLYGSIYVSVMKYLGYDILACCDNDKSLWGTKFQDVPVISPKELENLSKEHAEKKLLLQFAFGKEHEDSVRKQLSFCNISDCVSFSEGMNQLFPSLEEKLKSDYPDLEEKWQQSLDIMKDWLENSFSTSPQDKEEKGVLVLQPPKTGDSTIIGTLVQNNIPYLHGYHAPEKCKDRNKTQEIQKIIVGIRDPLARDISDTFQAVDSGFFFLLSYFSKEEVDKFIYRHGYVKKETK